MINRNLSKKINLFCLLAAITVVLILPFKKEIWYDETISILISKGISHDTPSLFAHADTVNSATIELLNTSDKVFKATVVDNGNSFLYNISLHWFTTTFGNSITAYMLFSKLCGIAALIAFFVLCNLFFENSLFTSFAMLLLILDNVFLGMSHEIRGYEMGAFFVIAAAVYAFRFMYVAEKPAYLFLSGLFAAGAILSHFLSVYAILVLFTALLVAKKSTLFSVRNLLALMVPVCILAVFFYATLSGLQNMNKQNDVIHKKAIVYGFSLLEVLFRSMKFTAVNFKAVFPAFRDKYPVILTSFFLILSLYIGSIRVAASKTEKRNLHLLFVLGFSGSLFLGLLSVKAHHYTSLYYRYYSFCIPFCCLFTAYALYVLSKSNQINKLVKAALFSIVVLPAAALFLSGFKNKNERRDYNHVATATEIVKGNLNRLEVSQWEDALLVQCLLPKGYKIDFIRNPVAPALTSSGSAIP